MAYNKRYRVSHTFENGSRFIGTIGIRNATPDFPENIEGRMIVESVNGRFQGVFKLVNGTVGRVSGVVLPPQPKIGSSSHKVQTSICKTRPGRTWKCLAPNSTSHPTGNPSMTVSSATGLPTMRNC